MRCPWLALALALAVCPPSRGAELNETECQETLSDGATIGWSQPGRCTPRSCDEGYEAVAGNVGCQPICESCLYGDCISPGSCRCWPAFEWQPLSAVCRGVPELLLPAKRCLAHCEAGCWQQQRHLAAAAPSCIELCRSGILEHCLQLEECVCASLNYRLICQSTDEELPQQYACINTTTQLEIRFDNENVTNPLTDLSTDGNRTDFDHPLVHKNRSKQPELPNEWKNQSSQLGNESSTERIDENRDIVDVDSRRCPKKWHNKGLDLQPDKMNRAEWVGSQQVNGTNGDGELLHGQWVDCLYTTIDFRDLYYRPKEVSDTTLIVALIVFFVIVFFIIIIISVYYFGKSSVGSSNV